MQKRNKKDKNFYRKKLTQEQYLQAVSFFSYDLVGKKEILQSPVEMFFSGVTGIFKNCKNNMLPWGKRGDDMIEIICREDLQKEEKAKEETLCLPKNIRQVGSPRGRHKIYIEDYVYTYLHTMAQKKESCAAVFLGRSQIIKDIRYTFVNGAVECGAAVFQWDNICLDDSFWEYIYKEEKRYFPETQIVGWFLGKTGQAMEISAVVEAAHRKYFAGRDKILMLMDVLEDEEIFFVYEQGYLQRREGYYIYYEKNLAMQEYMISKKEEERRLEELAELTAAENQAATEFFKPYRDLQKEEFAQLHRDLQKEEFAELHRDLEQEILERASSGSGTQIVKESGKTSEAENVTELQKAAGTKEVTGALRAAEIQGKSEDASNEQETRPEKYTERREVKQKKTEPEAKRSREKIFAKSNLEEPKTQAEEALESYRNMILERQGRQTERQNRNFLYTASSFFLVVICVIGITTINNYRKMQEVEDALHIMKDTVVSKEEKQTENKEDLVVESIASQVSPLEEESDKSKDSDKPKEKEEDKSRTEEEKDKAQNEEKKDDSQSEENSSHEAEETSAGQSEEVRYYTVQPGDTLDSICLSVYKSRDKLDQIREANGIEDGDKIFTGQKLLLP